MNRLGYALGTYITVIVEILHICICGRALANGSFTAWQGAWSCRRLTCDNYTSTGSRYSPNACLDWATACTEYCRGKPAPQIKHCLRLSQYFSLHSWVSDLNFLFSIACGLDEFAWDRSRRVVIDSQDPLWKGPPAGGQHRWWGFASWKWNERAVIVRYKESRADESLCKTLEVIAFSLREERARGGERE